ADATGGPGPYGRRRTHRQGCAGRAVPRAPHGARPRGKRHAFRGERHRRSGPLRSSPDPRAGVGLGAQFPAPLTGRRKGPGCPSGRPGTRWLRVGTEVVVYWASGPFPGRTCRSGGPPPPCPRGWRGPLASRVPRRGRWAWLPVAACTCGATPHGPAWSTQPRSAPGPTSCGGLGRTYSPPTSTCQHPCDLLGFAKSAGQYRLGRRVTTRRCPARAHRSAAWRKPQLTRSAAGGRSGRRPPCATPWAVGRRG
ncbi:hypothetical protein GA0115240_16246, partial [Streptomyces sp. DvalAA-14]